METNENFGAHLRGMQILVAAMALGLVAFATIALVFIEPEPNDEIATILPAILLAMIVIEVPVYRLLKQAGLRQAIGRLGPDADQEERRDTVFAVFRGTTVIGAAFAEGVGLFGVTGYIIGAPIWMLGGAAGGLLALFLIYPTENRIADAIDDALRDDTNRDRGVEP